MPSVPTTSRWPLSISAEPPAVREGITYDGVHFAYGLHPTLQDVSLTIPAGTEVTFLNADGFTHTVTEGTDGQPVGDPIVDEEIDQNGSVSVTFDEPGTYNITCKIHSSMNITITVEG